MQLNATELRKYIITPALQAMGAWSLAAENLVIGTGAQESHMGRWLQQMNNGPALGFYQMEDTLGYQDILKNVLPRYKELHPDVPLKNISENYAFLKYDIRLATVMTRLQYWRFDEPLPDADDIEGLAKYWKKYYNTEDGKGSWQEFVLNYRRFIMGK